VADAKACRKVFTAAWPITITPLDTCGLVHLRGDKYQKVLRRNSAVTSNLIQNYRAWQADGLKGERKGIDAANLARLVNNQLNSASSTLFDTVAVYLAINTDLVRMEQLPVEVTDDGYTKIVEGAKVIHCAVEWKSLDGFEDFLVERLTK
jgi:inosine-uridine nucleoside N-ribohydrolase